MSDSSDIDNALVSRLGADSVLLSFMPNGVYVDEAPPGSTRFVIVSLLSELDVAEFGRRAYEDALFLVKAVARSDTAAKIKDAAARIDALLENGTLTIPGYDLMTLHREERIRITEVDDVDPSIRWQHRGGHYRLVAGPRFDE